MALFNQQSVEHWTYNLIKVLGSSLIGDEVSWSNRQDIRASPDLYRGYHVLYHKKGLDRNPIDRKRLKLLKVALKSSLILTGYQTSF